MSSFEGVIPSGGSYRSGLRRDKNMGSILRYTFLVIFFTMCFLVPSVVVSYAASAQLFMKIEVPDTFEAVTICFC